MAAETAKNRPKRAERQSPPHHRPSPQKWNENPQKNPQNKKKTAIFPLENKKGLKNGKKQPKRLKK